MDFLHYELKNSDINYNLHGGRRRKNCASYAAGSCDEFGMVRQRSQANARERDRTHRSNRTEQPETNLGTSRSPLLPPIMQKTLKPNPSVNSAFTTLRTLIPTEPRDRKLSKIETLRLASSYISHLGTQLMAGPVDQPCLRVSQQFYDRDGSDRHQVCTFCIAHKKTPKSAGIADGYVCPVLEEQMYFAQCSPSQNVSLVPNAEINNIYYQ